MKSGIYQIVCRTTGERYIGSSGNIANRWSEHRSRLRKGVHSSATLQAAWNTYGEADFFFGVIVHLPKEEMRAAEISWLQAAEPAYNTAGIKGRRSKAYGKPKPHGHGQKVSRAMTGKRKSESHVMSMSRANIGKGRGYSKVKGCSRWRAHIRVSPMQRRYVYFRTEAEAAAWVAAQRATP